MSRRRQYLPTGSGLQRALRPLKAPPPPLSPQACCRLLESIGSGGSAGAAHVERSRQRDWAVSGQSDENSAVAAMGFGTAARSCAE